MSPSKPIPPYDPAVLARGLASERTAQRVVTCYTVFDKFFPTAGLLDYTEGIYNDDPATPYDAAKIAQLDYLLDEVGCGPGVRVLDLGCGNGTLLDRVKERGGIGVGVTITPAQVQLCRARGLDARLQDFFAMGPEWDGTFDAIVANGPIEHFVQLEQAANGQQDAIYREMFATMARLLDPASPIRRVVNTTVHFARAPDPKALLRSPLAYRPGSDDFHYRLLTLSFGGWYPVDGQLEACATGHFSLTRAVDGTRDYYYTSEEWLRRIRWALITPTALRIMLRSVPLLLRQPVQYFTMFATMLITRSWNWQFRGSDPPAKLWRQTWSCAPVEG
ncbi:MAG: class I SAM-dependent methyltransferase [Pseudomonadota bacterium]